MKGMPNDDIVLNKMLELDIPLTRQNYLNLAYLGSPPPEPLDAELEAELPEQFQKPDLYINGEEQ